MWIIVPFGSRQTLNKFQHLNWACMVYYVALWYFCLHTISLCAALQRVFCDNILIFHFKYQKMSNIRTQTLTNIA